MQRVLQTCSRGKGLWSLGRLCILYARSWFRGVGYDENVGTTSSDASTDTEEPDVQRDASSRAKFPAHHELVALLIEGDTMLLNLKVLKKVGWTFVAGA